MSNGNRGPGPIPNRWLHCPRKSEGIIAEKFIAFKTPLSSAFDDQMPLECMFHPEMIFGYCKTLKLTLGLWIDLTNTKRFYDRAVVEARGTQYVKLQCRGHGETPSPEQTQSFIEIVDNFINDRPFDLIGVHCTHGFNRTGFLIASYLVERLDFSVEAALATFTKIRPPGIYKQDYINELYRRYDDEDDAPPAPELPDWCLEYDDSNRGQQKRKYEEAHSSNSQQAIAARSQSHSNGSLGLIETLDDPDDKSQEDDNEADGNDVDDGNGGGGEGSSNGKPRKKRRREMIVKNAQFMEGVPGVTLVTDQPRLGDLQQKVQDMCGWKKSGFPGCQPVSMDCQNIRRLHEIPYRVSWKADGTRYMMLINKRDEIYFIDRNNSCFQVENLTFVKYNNLHEHLEDTLLDGEMVLDKYQGQKIPRYLIYDIIKISNRDIGKEHFYPNRLQCIDMEIINPRLKAIEKGIINRPAESFSLRKKDFWDIRQSASLLGEKFAKSLLHEPDGLIFQPSDQPYTAGVCQDVFKWKPLDMNSVDFRLKIGEESGQGILSRKICLLYVGGCDAPFAQMKFTKTIKAQNLDNKIVECTVNAKGEWELMRERTDKTMPNSYNTAKSVIESIRNPVTKEILLNFIETSGYRNDHDMMPPPRTNNQHNNHHQNAQRQQQHHHQQQHHSQQQIRPPPN
ncbi:RNA guanylyltransferase and 5'-phosphatase mRNA capping enzyme [Haematobia irritans]|uniref:RNA guanylyltransferase and 5'-phosphatase mRNA capping enzyme n=1 Tax=Haematobia irritans TaxID=7368 RepID=UPI003F504ECE